MGKLGWERVGVIEPGGQRWEAMRDGIHWQVTCSGLRTDKANLTGTWPGGRIVQHGLRESWRAWCERVHAALIGGGE